MSKDKKQGSKGASKPRTSAPQATQAQTAPIDEKTLGDGPTGFQEVMGERVKGFFAVQSGNVIQGILRDVCETKSKFTRTGRDGTTTNTKRVYKIEVTVEKPSLNGATLYNSSDEDLQDEPQEAVAGDLIGVDEKGWLKSLEKVVVGQEVWIACMGKNPPTPDYPQGNWIYKVKAKPLDPSKTNPVTGEVHS
jgi:hypothetical protein